MKIVLYEEKKIKIILDNMSFNYDEQSRVLET